MMEDDLDPEAILPLGDEEDEDEEGFDDEDLDSEEDSEEDEEDPTLI